ncbi:uncharacterized protein RAG0_12767 [Rhynchosporium agropyri]|uniref:Secreted protein n=1 Tax=Rhynchosporium agropyri TaxID=914238 RepID=A0A1E1L9I1_9HELO|nr:uncharacterized protein RAG0_12767 [Rhynchosporium agropyri]
MKSIFVILMATSLCSAAVLQAKHKVEHASAPCTSVGLHQLPIICVLPNGAGELSWSCNIVCHAADVKIKKTVGCSSAAERIASNVVPPSHLPYLETNLTMTMRSSLRVGQRFPAITLNAYLQPIPSKTNNLG